MKRRHVGTETDRHRGRPEETQRESHGKTAALLSHAKEMSGGTRSWTKQGRIFS